MKQNLFFILLIILMSVTGCRSINIIEDYSRCRRDYGKSLVLLYTYTTETKTLKLVCEGVFLNCCFKDVSASHEIKENHIFIKVKETFGIDRCRCVCPHRVVMNVPGVLKKKYIVHVSGVKLRINLMKQTSGERFFRRFN
jgi:hypothetical protein